MNDVRRKRGEPDRDVLRPFFAGRGVLHPFSARDDDRLAGADVERAAPGGHTHRAAQHDGVLVELRRLSRLDPAARTAHPRDARVRGAGVHAPDELLDQFRLVSCRLDDGGLRNVHGHGWAHCCMRRLLFVLAIAVSPIASADDFHWLVPLNDLGTAPYRWGYYGGLYEDGSNVMAADHLALGLAAASRIQPLDADGQPAANGKIVFLAVGFGETARIMQSFLTVAGNDVRVEHGKLVMLNAARDGADYRAWAEWPDATLDRKSTR